MDTRRVCSLPLKRGSRRQKSFFLLICFLLCSISTEYHRMQRRLLYYPVFDGLEVTRGLRSFHSPAMSRSIPSRASRSVTVLRTVCVFSNILENSSSRRHMISSTDMISTRPHLAGDYNRF